MARATDPTDLIRQAAAAFPAVAKGTSCTQSSFKAGKGTFLFIGPGPKGKGFKAMFRLKGSLPQAKRLSARDPDRFEVASNGLVTTRFTAEDPLPRSVWKKWLGESYDLTCNAGKKGAKKASR